MGLYARFVVPHLVHLAMRAKTLRPYRERIVGAAEGRVLELGIGSGLNLALYGPAVASVIGIEPSPLLLGKARAQSAAARIPVELREGSAEALPLESASIDTVVTTWTLCTIPDAGRALGEARRVLRPGGCLLFIEHGRAPEPSIARWQDRLDPWWSPLAGGCHLNRKIDDLLRGAGFHIETLRHSRLPGPPTHNFLYEGRAKPA